MFVLAYNSFIFSDKRILKNSKDDYLTGPFDEFDERWFTIIGCPIGLIIVFQLFTPHIPLFVKYLHVAIRRCHDRRWSLNARETRKTVQSEYEDLYTGPKFLLQIRYA